jgi:hypothetical protein
MPDESVTTPDNVTVGPLGAGVTTVGAAGLMGEDATDSPPHPADMSARRPLIAPATIEMERIRRVMTRNLFRFYRTEPFHVNGNVARTTGWQVYDEWP